MGLIITILKFGVFNGFLIGFSFAFNRQGSRTPNRLFGFLVISLSFIVLENLLIISKEILDFSQIFSVGSLFLTIIPPLNYLLSKSLIYPDRKIKTSEFILHAVPFLIIAASLLPLFTLSSSLKAEIIDEIYYQGKGFEPKHLLYSGFNLGQFFVYNWFVLKLNNNQKSNYKKKVLSKRVSWSQALFIAMNLLVLLYIVIYFLLVSTSTFNSTLMILFSGSILTLIYITGFQLIRNPFFFQRVSGIYNRSTLNQKVLDQLNHSLSFMIERDKPYLDSNLSLEAFASLLQVTPHQLSQYINQHLATTFTQLINEYRIGYAKRELLKLENKTILGVALDSGFNSQANFIRIFKKFTGCTPTDFRKGNIS